jgi:hypothetical protein
MQEMHQKNRLLSLILVDIKPKCPYTCKKTVPLLWTRHSQWAHISCQTFPSRLFARQILKQLWWLFQTNLGFHVFKIITYLSDSWSEKGILILTGLAVSC